MVSRRNDYSYLLNNLNLMAENYHINDNGLVVNLNNEEEKDGYVILNTQFYTLYCMAYKRFIEVVENVNIDYFNKGIIDRALSDYRTFNSFINNCICEYLMYDKIGTGYISYFPFKPLADFIMENSENKKVLTDYIICELEKLAKLEQEKERVKKKI